MMMTWRDDAERYVTASGHEGEIRKDFLDKHESDMIFCERKINDFLGGDPDFEGVRFSMSGLIDSPTFCLDGYHRRAKIAVCETMIDIDYPDWDNVADEFIAKWEEIQSTGGAEAVNAWYDEQDKWGWD